MTNPELAEKAIAYCRQSIADEQRYIDTDFADEHRVRRARHRILQLQDAIEYLTDFPWSTNPPKDTP